MSAAVSIAPASERALDGGAYLAGALVLALIVGSAALAAWRIRRALLPGWSGAPARLSESVLGLALVVWLAEALGTFGAYTELAMAVGSVVLAALSFAACARLEANRPAASAPAPPAPSASRTAIWLAAGGCAIVVAAWMVPTLGSLAGGMDRADTLWYHMPLATRFATTGNLGAIDYFDPIFFATYYPANSEVMHSIGILAFDRDIVSPLLNLGFLALSLLACYCIGRPWGVGPQSLIGGSIALGGQNLAEFQAGEALNDITGVAFVLAAVAILLNARAASTQDPIASPPTGLPGPALALAGIAAGLAAGTKLSFLVPIVVLWAGLIVIAGRGARLRTALWFGIPALAAGGYWYARNLIAIGNPIPFTSFGPLGLPAPERSFELRPGYSVAHYWNDAGVWGDWFIPGLHESFGVLWPLTIAAFLGAGVYALWRGSDPLIRVLGAVVVLAAVAYLFTPLTAAGEEGEPIAFQWNVRYVAPAAAVGLALLPCLPVARAPPRARTRTLAGLTVLLVATVASLVQWQQGHVKGAIAAAVGVIVGFALLRWLLGRGRIGPGAPRRLGVAVAGLAAFGALVAGWWEQNHYLERRYENLSPELHLAEAARWARDLRGARIAIGGVRGVFTQFVYYGTDLSNEVQWLGKEGPDGAFLRIPSCVEWRQALADGGYTHVVTTYDPYRPANGLDPKEARWTRADPSATEVLRDGPVSIFELDGPPDPGSCGNLPDLSAAERNGDSVNAEALYKPS